MKNFLKSMFYNVFSVLCSKISFFFRKILRIRSGDIEKLRNKYQGKRCFIVCTGPSLSFADLEKIKNEYSFGMNSIVKVLNQTDWKPTFYGIQDENVYEKLQGSIMAANIAEFFVSDRLQLDKKEAKIHSFHLDFYGHRFICERPRYKFSNDPSICVFDGFSITYSLMQIAIYMGFTEIYLLGCDCNYDRDPDKQHFVSSGHIDPNASKMGRLQNLAFEEANDYAKKHNVRVLNATRGGKLETFERVSFDDLFNDGEQY